MRQTFETRTRKEDTHKEDRLFNVFGIVNVWSRLERSGKMAKQVMMVVMVLVMLAGTAHAAPFTSAGNGYWSTQEQSTRTDTWGVVPYPVTPPVASVDYPWAVDDANPANDDTATILTGHTVTINPDISPINRK